MAATGGPLYFMFLAPPPPLWPSWIRYWIEIELFIDVHLPRQKRLNVWPHALFLFTDTNLQHRYPIELKRERSAIGNEISWHTIIHVDDTSWRFPICRLANLGGIYRGHSNLSLPGDRSIKNLCLKNGGEPKIWLQRKFPLWYKFLSVIGTSEVWSASCLTLPLLDPSLVIDCLIVISCLARLRTFLYSKGETFNLDLQL